MKNNFILESEIKRFKQLSGHKREKSISFISENTNKRNNFTFEFGDEKLEKERILEMHGLLRKEKGTPKFNLPINYFVYDLHECKMESEEEAELRGFLREQDETTNTETETEDELDDISAEDVKTPEFEDFLKIYFKSFDEKYGDDPKPEGEEENDVDSFLQTESNLKKNNFLNEVRYVYPWQREWWRIVGKKFKRWRNRKWDAFKDWMEKVFDGKPSELLDDMAKKWRKFKKKMKKKLNKAKRKVKKAMRVNLKDVWWKNKERSIQIGAWKYIKLGKGEAGDRWSFDSSEGYVPSTDPEEWDSYLAENEGTMVKLMNGTSKKMWEKLKADTEHKGFAVAVLEYFNTSYKQSKWKKVFVGMSKEEIEKEIPAKNPEPVEKFYPEIPIDFPAIDGADQLFKDNCYDLANAPVLQSSVDEFIAQVEEMMEGLNPREGKPKAWLKEIWLESSCSRFRNTDGNTCKAAKLTFAELGELRLKTAKDYIFQRLQEIGVLIGQAGSETTKETYDFLAKKSKHNPDGNGDGSSGPNPGKNEQGTPYAITKDGTFSNLAPESDRNKYGTPLKGREDYEQFKYVRGTLVIVFNDSYPVDPDIKKDKLEPNIEYIDVTNYPVYFYRPPKYPFRIAIPGLKIRWKKLLTFKSRRSKPTYGPPNKKPGATKCEAFGG